MASNPRLVIIKDDVPAVVAAINELVGKEVLVGIPDSSTDRDQEEAQPITNATLGYIHENGAPEANIPARPFLIPGVEKAEEPTLERLKKAAQVTMRGDTKSADKYLNDAGIIASNSVKRTFWENNWEPLKPSTIANRHRQRGTKMRDAERQYLGLIGEGMSPADAQAAAGIQPLVDTAQLRNAITYVIRKAK
jgi:hypothetical protein